MKSKLAVTSAVATAFLAGCSNGKPDQSGTHNAQICADVNGNRVEDSKCEKRAGGRVAGFHSWYYLTRGGSVPAIGEKISGGSFSPTKGLQYAKSGGVEGASERGGFGKSGRTVVVHS